MVVPAGRRRIAGADRPALGATRDRRLHGRQELRVAKRFDLGDLEKRPDWNSWAVVAAHLCLVLAPVYLAAYAGPSWSWLLLWAWSGVLMNGLLNLMHECAHFHVFRHRALSDLCGHWIVGPLLVADFAGYRQRHWEHHKHLGEDGDTKDA